MHGPVLTMPAALDANSALLRSHSSSDLPDLIRVDYKSKPAQHDDGLPRSASFGGLPILENLPYGSKDQVQRIVSAHAMPKPPEEVDEPKSRKEGKGTLVKEEKPKLDRVGRRKSFVSGPKAWIQRVRGSPERNQPIEVVDTAPEVIPPVPALPKPYREKPKKVSESFATFARKSWINTSRSPSPRRDREKETEQDVESGDASQDAASSAPSSTSTSASPSISTSISTSIPSSVSSQSLEAPPQIEKPAPAKLSTSPPKAFSRRTSTLQKIKQRPQSVLMNFSTFNSANSSASSLPTSSTDHRSTPRTSIDKVPPVPSLDKLQNLHPETPRRRDELWSAFRSLENDFSKFQAKSWSLKTNVVRASLLPFLRNHASHPSNRNLRPEDLDRRVKILNKWWLGLLEVLDGRQNQVVSGVDRPVLLEATLAIMMRPEWRMSPSAFAPLSERPPDHFNERTPLRNKKSSGSLSSSSSQFLTDSIYHNIRILFIQNLLAQMRFVVDKMSLRHAPASLVTFCGKAAAYAFFFVPGVADMLVRLWRPQADTLRRAADELGLPRRVNKLDTDDVVATFPSHIQSLGWTSAKSMTAQLQKKPPFPVLAGNVPWSGPWVSRWCGRDSDLFFVFTKHYHILAEEFLPSDLPLSAKARAPGFVLVQAQLLTALDGTIHRAPPPEPLPITFDDVLAGADASAAALPLPSSNSARLMAENRLIMLLRDFVSEKPSDYEAARMTFAESFEKVMQAAARRTSLFDHNACFILCDFMEEALYIFVRFHLSRPLASDFVDWYFWLEVCKKMLESQNSMSEIRLFSFLYGTWGVLTSNERRKEVVCLDWLLTEESFGRFFNHWCPMVRAYYMRLLCWRLCRDDGEPTELDTKIFSAVAARLQSNWAQYLFLKQAAEEDYTLPPSTVPCHPAPGRRLLIIRNDNLPPASSLFLGFDGVTTASLKGTTKSNAYKRLSTPASLSNLESTDSFASKLTSDAPTTPTKRRWAFMGKIRPGSSASDTASPPRGSGPAKTLEEARREMALSRTGHAKNPSSDSETPPSTSNHRAYSFKFSLEWAQNFERAQNVSWEQSNAPGAGYNIGHERQLSAPKLPAPAQSCLEAQVPGVSMDVLPMDPGQGGSGSEGVARAKYAGRALAEWAIIVGECNNFVQRRRAEGVPGLRWVEVPTLGVEGFRRFN